MNQTPFHLAFPVDDLAKARAFYGELLGCAEGRSSPEWVDFDFYGHQIVAHLAPGEVGQRGGQFRLAELGPQDVGHPEFGVTDLPEEEVRESPFPGR
ncbi:MAG: VOC family protein, partial [Burkholderiales bacterium]